MPCGDEHKPFSPTPWSKDFVEHLRTVHFTLIGVAIGLIVIVLSAKPYDPAAALRQIHQIIELKRMWSRNWILRTGIKREMPRPDEAEKNGKSQLCTMGVEAKWNNDPLMPDSSTPNSSPIPPDLDDFNNFPIPDNGFLYGQIDVEQKKRTIQFSIPQNWAQQHTVPDWSPEAFPSTLSDFEQWWNVLTTKNYEAVIPRSVYFRDVKVVSVSGGAGVSLREQPQGTRIKLSNKVELVIDEVTDISDKVALAVEANPESNSLEYTGVGPGGMYLFPVGRFACVAVSQQMLGYRFSGGKTGKFKDSFPDLDKAGQNLATLELDDIEKFIATEAAKGTEVFEVFGIKFPAGQITLWGFVVLLGVQIYFFIYLKQLWGKLSPAAAGWDVPWIGMTSSPLSQIIFFLTVMLLPLIAVVLLGTYSLSHLGNPRISNWQSIAKILGLICVLVSTLILGALCWKYRPQLGVGTELSKLSPDQTSI